MSKNINSVILFYQLNDSTYVKYKVNTITDSRQVSILGEETENASDTFKQTDALISFVNENIIKAVSDEDADDESNLQSCAVDEADVSDASPAGTEDDHYEPLPDQSVLKWRIHIIFADDTSYVDEGFDDFPEYFDKLVNIIEN